MLHPKGRSYKHGQVGNLLHPFYINSLFHFTSLGHIVKNNMRCLMKKLLIGLLSIFALAACNKASDTTAATNSIAVVSREAGSGTRSAFIELTGVLATVDGKKTDQTTKEATVANQTAVMMNSVAGNPYAIGYISMGSLNSTVKAVSIDGVAATVDNIKSGDYKLARPFNIVLSTQANAAAQDFVNFIMSAEGQMVVANVFLEIIRSVHPLL
jgi:phosphate transport system substrate-binding protein